MKNGDKMMNTQNAGAVVRFTLAAAFAAFACCGNMLADDGKAKEWKVGAPVPGMPHVIMGAGEGQYLPEPGWKFASDAAGDFSVMPVEAKEARVPAWGKDLRIPAPEGFWTLEDENPIAKLLNLQTDVDTKSKTIGIWARTESGLWDDIQSAGVKVTHTFYDKRMSLSAFGMACEAMQKEYEDLAKKSAAAVNKMAESVSREATRLAETNVSVSVDDVRFLPPYSVARDRFCFTVVRRERNDIGGEKSISFSVTSGAMLWVRGTAFNLYVAYGVVEKESDLEGAITATRDKLAKWIAAVVAVNDREHIDDEDAVAKSDPDCIDPEKQQRSSWSPIGGRILMWTVIGGVWGLLSSLFKKKS